MNLHFVDLNQEFIDAISKKFLEGGYTNIEYTCGSVETIDPNYKAFISPGNSLGFMDGGIDYVYSRKMFPGVEQKIKAMIKGLSQESYLIQQGISLITRLGRPYMKIGSAVCQIVGPNSCIIACPTMFLPHDVSMTQNAYNAFMAALLMVKKKSPNKTIIVCPALCCGYGKMSPEISADQIYRAYIDFHNGIFPQDYSKWKNIVITDSHDHEQPNNYDNREIKDIDVSIL